MNIRDNNCFYNSYHQPLIDSGFFVFSHVNRIFLNEFIGICKKNPDHLSRFDELENFLECYFSDEYLAVLYTEFYSKNKFIKKFDGLIFQSIVSFKLGLYSVAITSLLPVVEVCVNDMYDALEKDCSDNFIKSKYIKNEPNFKEKLSDVTTHVAKVAHCDDDGVYSERTGVCDSFKEYVSRFFWSPSDKRSEPTLLIRNGILHGCYSDADYARPINFYKLIFIINYFHFACAFTKYGGRISNPSATEESQQKEKLFIRARLLSNFLQLK
ncbi:UNVERIFIED_ORG: hypothetical protein HNP28_002675 [Comamonas terrigena]